MVYLFLIIILYLITTSVSVYTTNNLNTNIIYDILEEYKIDSSFYTALDDSSLYYLNKRIKLSFIPILHFYIIKYNINKSNYDKLYNRMLKRLLNKNRIVLRSLNNNKECNKNLDYNNYSYDCNTSYSDYSYDISSKGFANNICSDISVDEFENEIMLQNICELDSKTYIYAKYLLYIYKREKNKITKLDILNQADIVILDKYIGYLEILLNSYEEKNINSIKKLVKDDNNFHK